MLWVSLVGAPLGAPWAGNLSRRSREPRPYGQLRQAEIENLRLVPSCHKDICRFDVAMGNPFRVGRIQPIRNLNRQLQERSDL
jgi:hypothetical protein